MTKSKLFGKNIFEGFPQTNPFSTGNPISADPLSLSINSSSI